MKTPFRFAPHLPQLTADLAGDNLREATLDIMLALAEAGVREQGGNNRGPWIKELLDRATIKVPAPWCQASINACAEVAAEMLDCKSPLEKVPLQAYVESHYQWAKKNGILVSAADALPGDLVLFWTSSLKRHGHVGLLREKVDTKNRVLKTVEGNTNGAGSREGDQVALKTRQLVSTTKFVRWTSMKVWED